MKFDPATYLAQVGLKSLGFDPGIADGLDGKNTRAAIAAFVASPLNPKAPPLGREVNAAGLALIKHFEGLYLKAYRDPVGIWTIGFGHTGLTHRDGTVYAGRTVTEKEAENLLKLDLANFCRRVASVVKVPLTEDQFSALVSFDFNTGGLPSSTLLKRLNAGDYAEAANQFLRWDKAGGKTLAGLTRRRKSERNLFLGIHPAIIP